MLAPILPHPTLPEPERVKPSREDATEAIITAAEANAYQITRGYITESDCRIYADAVLALLPGRSALWAQVDAWDEGYIAGSKRNGTTTNPYHADALRTDRLESETDHD